MGRHSSAGRRRQWRAAAARGGCGCAAGRRQRAGACAGDASCLLHHSATARARCPPLSPLLPPRVQAFDDIDGLLEGPQGFDSSSSVWHQTGAARGALLAVARAAAPAAMHPMTRAACCGQRLPARPPLLLAHLAVLRLLCCAAPGWREVASLRKKLEDLKELRELVRQLGRGGGKGPLKKAPEQVRRGLWRHRAAALQHSGQGQRGAGRLAGGGLLHTRRQRPCRVMRR